MKPIIKVEGLSKQYRIGTRQTAHDTLKEKIVETARAPFRRLRRGASDGETMWALKDVTFDISPGEVVGIVGRNGAGKSTLLKILSRITEPTSGRAQLYGRVGSLLEVGTGFHPELTGRENIYLNGAILGMRKAEIESKFDEIVAFAGTEKFLDTPVKHYSSGMYVRLAFAVAAHLQPEILLVDEVLAVGDVEFQRKCIGRMEKAAGEGKTVVVVSHSVSTVKALCSRAVLIDSGVVKAVGKVDDVIKEYLSAVEGGLQVDAAEKVVSEQEHVGGVHQIRVNRIRLIGGVLSSFSVYWRQPITVELEIEVLEPVNDLSFGAGIRTLDGVNVFTVHHDDDMALPSWALAPGNYRVVFTLENNLRPGVYKLHVGADRGRMLMKNVYAVDAITLAVLEHTEDGGTPLATNTGLINGRSSWASPEVLS